MGKATAENLLYYGDNLDVLRRHIEDESTDLIYLDPPFNSNVLRRDGLTPSRTRKSSRPSTRANENSKPPEAVASATA